MRQFSKYLVISVFLCAASCLRADPSLFFVANEGQWPGDFAFRYQGGGGVWYITPSGLTIDLKTYDSPVGAPHAAPVLTTSHPPGWDDDARPTFVRGHVLKVNFLNANPSPEITGSDKLSSYSNYFFGRDSTQWRSWVGHYQKVVAKGGLAGD